LKACMVSKHFFPYAGGLEARVLELARWLVERGDGVVVVTSLEAGTRPSETVGGVGVRRYAAWLDVLNAPLVPGMLSGLLREEYDVVDANLPDPFGSLCAWLACVLRRKPLVVTYHADIVKEGALAGAFKLLYSPIQGLVLGRAERILVTSPNYARESRTLAPYMGKVEVAPSFIDPRRFNPGADGSALRKRFGGRVVLFVGRLVPYKGVEYLLEAAKAVADATFVVVGDGPLRASLEERAAGLGNVVFAGQVSEEALPAYYAACDVFVLPSVTRQEAFGLVLVEAMACGKPVVSTDFSGMPYVVGDGGITVPPGDAKALADAVSKVLRDRALASELALRGRRRVAELFTRDAVCARVRGIYMAAANKGKT
jgi:glycosyltransferase involved in cell wall biosynthesis